MRWRHIIWDWNGTLLDDLWLSLDIINTMVVRYGLPHVDEATYKRIFDFPVRNYYLKLGFDFSRTPFEEVGGKFIDAYTTRWTECRLQDGAEAALRHVRESGVRQSILSAAARSLVEGGVKHFELGKYFANVVSLDNPWAEGKIEAGRRFMERIDCGPEDTLLIGDTAHDFEVAGALGINCVLLTCGHHPRAKLEPTGAPVLDSPAEAVGYLENPV